MFHSQPHVPLKPGASIVAFSWDEVASCHKVVCPHDERMTRTQQQYYTNGRIDFQNNRFQLVYFVICTAGPSKLQNKQQPQHFLILHSIKKLLMSNSMDNPELRNWYFSIKHKNNIIHWFLRWMTFKSQPLLTAKAPRFPRKNAKLQQLLQRWQQCCSWSFRGRQFQGLGWPNKNFGREACMYKQVCMDSKLHTYMGDWWELINIDSKTEVGVVQLCRLRFLSVNVSCIWLATTLKRTWEKNT